MRARDREKRVYVCASSFLGLLEANFYTKFDPNCYVFLLSLSRDDDNLQRRSCEVIAIAIARYKTPSAK